MGRKIFALDIREDAVSAVLISSRIKGNSVDAHFHVPVDDLSNGIQEPLEAVLEAIPVDGATCIVSLPASEMTFRNITVPFKNRKKIRQILPYELEPTLPVSIDQMSIDFLALQVAENGDESDILAACVENDRLTAYLDALGGSNLHPELVTIGGFPMAYCSSQLSDFPDNGLVLDLGRAVSTLFVIVARQVCLIRSIPAGFTDSSSIAILSKGIRQTLYAFEDIFTGDYQPEGVLITGSTANDTELAQQMSGLLEIPVKTSNLMADLDFSIRKETADSWNSIHMDNALSLVQMELKGVGLFNYRRGTFSERKLWADHGKQFTQKGILAAVLLILVFLNLYFDIDTLNRRVVQLDQKITTVFKETFPEIKRIVDPLHQMRVAMDDVKTGGTFPEEFEKKARTIDILNYLSEQIPKETDVELTRLVIGPDTVLVSGNTDTFNTVDDIKNKLETVSAFEKVTISSANVDRADNRVRFKMKVDLEALGNKDSS